MQNEDGEVVGLFQPFFNLKNWSSEILKSNMIKFLPGYMHLDYPTSIEIVQVNSIKPCSLNNV